MKLQNMILITLSAVACCFGASVGDIQVDVNNLTGNITAFTGVLPAFDPSNIVSSGIGLLVSLEGILLALSESTTDALALKHPVTNVTGLITIVTSLSTTIPNALTAVVNAKSTLEAIPTSGSIADGAVGGVLASLQKLSDAFINATIAALPAAQKAQLTSVQTTIDSAYTNAISTFGANLCQS